MYCISQYQQIKALYHMSKDTLHNKHQTQLFVHQSKSIEQTYIEIIPIYPILRLCNFVVACMCILVVACRKKEQTHSSSRARTQICFYKTINNLLELEWGLICASSPDWTSWQQNHPRNPAQSSQESTTSTAQGFEGRGKCPQSEELLWHSQ